jgi:hypothetical protein
VVVDWWKKAEVALLPWSKIVAPIFVPSSKNGVEAHAIGTGFLFCNGESVYLATAAHALDDFADGLTFAVVFDSAIEIEASLFRRCSESDVAICNITTHVSFLPVDASIPCLDRRALPPETSAYIILGYPESKNRIERYKSLDRSCLRVAATKIPGPVPSDCRVRSPLLLSRERGGRYKKGGAEGFDLPDMRGVSGGPVLALIPGKESREGRFVLAGVIVEQRHTKPRCFVVANISNVLELVESARA